MWSWSEDSLNCIDQHGRWQMNFYWYDLFELEDKIFGSSVARVEKGNPFYASCKGLGGTFNKPWSGCMNITKERYLFHGSWSHRQRVSYKKSLPISFSNLEMIGLFIEGLFAQILRLVAYLASLLLHQCFIYISYVYF